MKDDGIAINVEHPHPGSGGRHRSTLTYGTTADVEMRPRNALAAGIRDLRRIYQRDGLYSQRIRAALLIHTIEGYDRDAYLRELLRGTDSVLKRSPGWATVLFMRTLNAPEARPALVQAIRETSINNHRAIREVLDRVRDRRPILSECVTGLLEHMPPVSLN